MCFGSTLGYLHKEFLNPPRTKYNPLLPHLAASSTRTCNLCGLTCPAQESSVYIYILHVLEWRDWFYVGIGNMTKEIVGNLNLKCLW